MSIANFNNTTPAAPGGNTNVTWQKSGDSISGYVPDSTSPLTTKGDLFGFDTAADRIPVGTDGDVLTADSGAALGVSWQPAGGGGGGGLVLLATETASSSANLTFATRNASGQSGAIFQSDFDDYLFVVDQLIYGTSGVIGWQMSTAGTFDTGSSYVYQGGFFDSTGSGGFAATTAGKDVAIQLWNSSDTLIAGYGICGKWLLHNPLGTVLNKQMNSDSYCYPRTAASPRIDTMTESGAWVNTAAMDKIRLIPSAGNITSGVIRCYGLAK